MSYSIRGGTVVTVADFNRDGKTDFAALSWDPSTVSIFLGRGNGTFQLKNEVPVGLDPFTSAVADLDGDGNPDLVIGSRVEVWVLMGGGDGTFRMASRYTLGGSAFSLAVADFNGDGKPDVSTTNPFADYFTILPGNGDGTFQPGTQYLAGPFEEPLVAADFDGDGRTDLAIGNSIDDVVTIALNLGNGNFAQAARFPAGSNVYSLAAADLNRDGNVDIVAESGGAVAILLGDGQGGFPNAARDYALGRFPNAVLAADLNGDGVDDLAVATGLFDPGSAVSVLVGRGDGTFHDPVDYVVGEEPEDIAVADLNGDGHLDLVAPIFTGVSVLLGNGDGTFQPEARVVTGLQPLSVAVSDLNLDGKPDLVVANYGDFGGGDPQTRKLSVLLARGNATFEAPNDIVMPNNPSAVTAADFNRDGKPDLAVAISPAVGADTDSEVLVFLGRGTGGLLPAIHLLTEWGPAFIAAADLNGDGTLDLAAANLQSNSVSVFQGSGDGTFENARNYRVEPAPFSLTASDLNGDGKPDLAVASGGGASILLNQGNGTFRSSTGFVTGVFPRGIASGDFDGNGLPDLAVANNASFTLSIVTNSSRLISVLPVQLPDGKQGTAYSQHFSASGTGPKTYTLVDGALPQGLSLTEDGLLAGTPEAAGVFQFTIAADSASGCGQRDYTISIGSTHTCRRCTRTLPPRPAH